MWLRVRPVSGLNCRADTVARDMSLRKVVHTAATTFVPWQLNHENVLIFQARTRVGLRFLAGLLAAPGNREPLFRPRTMIRRPRQTRVT